MHRLFLSISLAFALISAVEAREPTSFETYCINTMFHLETKLASYLPNDYEIIETHPSQLGPELVQGYYVRDCWISHNHQVVATIVLFDISQSNDPSLFGATYTQVRLETERNGENVVLGIGVLGKDQWLVQKLIRFINRIPFREFKAMTQTSNLIYTMCRKHMYNTTRLQPLPVRSEFS